MRAAVIGAPNRLDDAMRRPDARGREVETALAIHLEPFMLRNALSSNDMLRALMGNIVALVMAKAGSQAEARMGIEIITSVMLRRVTDH